MRDTSALLSSTPTSLATASALLLHTQSAAKSAPTFIAHNTADMFMPEEGSKHARTWMGFGASETIWGKKLLPEVRRNLATIAEVISQYEPVSMLVRPAEMNLARQLMSSAIELVPCPLDDLWLRDTAPTFITNETGEIAAVDFNFNGWGKKQAHRRDRNVAAEIARQIPVPHVRTKLVLEGGAIEVDGAGTAIITESCTLIDNRNPRLSKAAFEDILLPLLGLERIIWLPGIRGRDITDGHTDFYARFANPNEIVVGYDPDPASYDHAVTLKHLEILRAATNAQGQKYRLHILEAPATIREKYNSSDFAAGYVGYYLCNGALIMQTFGDKATDGRAKRTLQKAYPGRKIEQISIDGIAAGGGSIHCTTQQQPARL